MEKKKIKLVDDICERLKREGKAKYDFGTFYLFKRKAHKAVLPDGRQLMIKPYNAVFFRSSRKLRRKINENRN